ncbi:hypothetical protein [Arthrobacter sp. UYCu712]|uniref:hypothetical protein n=1 Tax=Arthrobacter sp. UYCu712 TaxID=3156340 RepID=UPI003399C3F0
MPPTLSSKKKLLLGTMFCARKTIWTLSSAYMTAGERITALMSIGGSMGSAAMDGAADKAIIATTNVKTIASERRSSVKHFIESFPP